MATSNPLYIPIQVRALQVNAQVYDSVNYLRPPWDYSKVPEFLSPQPAPFESPRTNFSSPGIQLHWTLPAPLRHAVQDPVSGAVDYPYVPNRWLVVRYGGPANNRQATGWVVQSDYLDDQNGTAPFLDPHAPSPRVTRVGRAVSLSSWTNPYPEPSLFLTAVAPGNPLFASFQAYCPNVFSMIDPLYGVETDTLSYLVAGWYSRQDEDFIGRWQDMEPPDFDAFLEGHGWTLTEGQSNTATWAVYHGMVSGIEWSLYGPEPVSSRPANGGALPLAVGNTSVEAFTALLESQQAQQDGATLQPRMLEAFQNGLLPRFDQQDAQFELAIAQERATFGARDGGFHWEIVDAPLAPGATPPPPLPPEELQREAGWLAGLNQAQRDYEQALADLTAMQWYLYSLWWKDGYARNNLSSYPTTATQAQFAAAFDSTNPASVVSQVQAQLQRVASLRAAVPTGATQDALAAAIDAYASARQLPATRQLKQLARTPFFRANDPVLLIQGLKLDPSLAPLRPVQCRFASELVTGVVYQGANLTAASMSRHVPRPDGLNSGQVPLELEPLVDEFFILDPCNATMVAQYGLGTTSQQTIDDLRAVMASHDADIGTVPDFDLAPWVQPWSPLVLQWTVVLYPIPFEHGGTRPWTFDGEDYDWNGDTSVVGYGVEINGTTFLTPQASDNFRAQLQNYLNDNPGSPVANALRDFIEQVDDWDFMSQSLVGLTQQWLLRSPQPYQSVTADPATYFQGTQTLASLVGAAATYAPMPGSPAATTGSLTNFQPWRAGQFFFSRLAVIDRFGQRLDLVTPQTNNDTAPIVSDSLRPTHPVSTQSPQRFIQLPPRLLQPGRMEADFVSGADDSAVFGLAPEVNPICAWLLHNYLDQSLAVYANDGQSLGAVWVVTDTTGQERVHWQPAPGSPYLTVQSLMGAPPVHHVGQFLQALQARGPSAFRALVATVDARSWTLDSGDPSQDQALAMLAGRPIAMVRTQLKLSLDGPPVTDPSWPYTFQPALPVFTAYDFAVRVGEGNMRQDGLMGYFMGEDYDTFFAPDVPDALSAQDYVRPIGSNSGLTLAFDPGSAALLTVLMDPRAAVHVTTGILPVASFALPQAFVDLAFANMELTFRQGPVLSEEQIPEGESTPTLRIPRPVEKNGTWDWLTYDGTTWSSRLVAPVDAVARFSNVTPELRTGLLRLSGVWSEGGEGAARVRRKPRG